MTVTANVSMETATPTAAMPAASMSGMAGQHAAAVTVSGSSTPNSTSNNNKTSGMVDTVTLVSRSSELEKSEIRDEAVRAEKTREEKRKEQQQTVGIGEVQFTYNSRGDLRVRFMDSKHGLIYQTPPVMYARMSDLMSQMKVSVNTEA